MNLLFSLPNFVVYDSPNVEYPESGVVVVDGVVYLVEAGACADYFLSYRKKSRVHIG